MWGWQRIACTLPTLGIEALPCGGQIRDEAVKGFAHSFACSKGLWVFQKVEDFVQDMAGEGKQMGGLFLAGVGC